MYNPAVKKKLIKSKISDTKAHRKKESHQPSSHHRFITIIKMIIFLANTHTRREDVEN